MIAASIAIFALLAVFLGELIFQFGDRARCALLGHRRHGFTCLRCGARA